MRRNGAGLPLHLVQRGAGPPLLMLHGFTGSVGAWPEPVLHSLAERAHLLICDLPGHGGSGPQTDPEDHHVRVVIDRILATLDSVAVERATWLGYSMGGRVALAAAVHHPDRMAGLILESSSPGLESEHDRQDRRAADELLARRLESAGTAAFVETWMGQPLFATQKALDSDRLEIERRRRVRNDARSLAACLRGLGTGSQPSFWDRLPEIRIPTLVLTGGLDEKFTEIGRRMRERMPLASQVVVAESGHAIHLERGDVWTRQVERFHAGLTDE